MFEKALILYIYAETPMHPGSGTVINAPVDLPIQRERHTGFPIVQGSSLKGVLKTHAKDMGIDNNTRDEIFGKEDMIGGISVTDARILAFPVRTLAGVFGWVTCPFVLERFKKDQNIAGITVEYEIPEIENPEKALVNEDSNVKIDKNVYIEDLQLEIDYDKKNIIKYNQIIEELSKALPTNVVYTGTINKFKKDLVIVHNEVFRDLIQTCTEIVARVRIGDEGVVEEGPWNEEYLPTDTLMYSLILLPKKQDLVVKLMEYNGKLIQIGGSETIGKGFARIKIGEGN